jgi:hypothetical protein
MLTTLHAWLVCFERRAMKPAEMPDLACDTLSAYERNRIGRSLATFQLGEQSEGRTLLGLASRYAARHDCPALVRITECFIREERRHAAILRSFIEDNEIPCRERDWTDGIFRILRRLAGFELAITVLLTAEMIGVQYYRALMNSTSSRRLRAICSLFMQDEAFHVAYESELLLALRRRRVAPLRAVTTMAHGIFHALAALVVGFEHRGVLKVAGHSPLGFLRLCLRHYALYFLVPATPMKWAASIGEDDSATGHDVRPTALLAALQKLPRKLNDSF